MAIEQILIVEDEPEFADLLALWIGKAGYGTTIARTGRDGLRLFYEVHPSLVLLDLSLPGFDGLQLIERIREFSRVPILVVTARSGEADQVRGLKLGADDYVTKPLSFPELLARVEAALRRAGLGATENARRLRHGDIVVDLDEHRASHTGRPTIVWRRAVGPRDSDRTAGAARRPSRPRWRVEGVAGDAGAA